VLNPPRDLPSASMCCLFFIPSISQDLAYHQFFDIRAFLYIPNILNVLSTLPYYWLVGIFVVEATG